jgi:hypothetical protein
VIPLIRKMFRDFFYDEMVAAKLVRGFLLWSGGMAVSVLAYPFDDVVTWDAKEWAYRVAAAGALGFAGMITAGQKNQTPEQIRAELDALKAKP